MIILTFISEINKVNRRDVKREERDDDCIKKSEHINDNEFGFDNDDDSGRKIWTDNNKENHKYGEEIYNRSHNNVISNETFRKYYRWFYSTWWRTIICHKRRTKWFVEYNHLWN